MRHSAGTDALKTMGRRPDNTRRRPYVVAVIELEDTEGRMLQIVCPSATERLRIEAPTDETRL